MNARYFLPIFDRSVRRWSSSARILRWLTFLWLFIGLVTLFSASYAVAEADFGDGLHYFKNQLVWVLLGLAGFNLFVHTPLKTTLKATPVVTLLLTGLILLTLVPGVGTDVNGATRWLAIGPFLIQPSELIKPFLVLQGASVLSQWRHRRLGNRLVWLTVFGLILGGILVQPNLSNAVLCSSTLWILALAAGIPYAYLLSMAASGLGLATLSVHFNEYQLRRITSFLNPWADPAQDGYQLIQSLLAVGSGGLHGTGLGLSQQKLFYLPIQHTDFIFAVFAEEFGFIGCLLLLSMLLVYATVALRVAIQAQKRVHRLVAIGVMFLLIGQSFLNMGVATGVLPTTGLTFPFMSYGGNSIICSFVAAALLIRVARESREADVVVLRQGLRGG